MWYLIILKKILTKCALLIELSWATVCMSYSNGITGISIQINKKNIGRILLQHALETSVSMCLLRKSRRGSVFGFVWTCEDSVELETVGWRAAKEAKRSGDLPAALLLWCSVDYKLHFTSEAEFRLFGFKVMAEREDWAALCS